MNVLKNFQKRIMSYLVSTLMILFFLSCNDGPTNSSEELHDPSKPILVTSFYPTEGGGKK